MNIVTKTPWRRAARALSLLLLGAASVVGVTFSVIAHFMGETARANFAFALIVISILVSLSVLTSHGASLRIQRTARIAWLTVAVMCLIFAQYVLNLDYPDAHKAAETVMLVAMLALTFPTGCVAIGLSFLYSYLVLPDRGANPVDLLILWSAFFVAGYVQWFKLLPWIIKQSKGPPIN